MLIKSEVHLLSHLRGKQHETAIGGRDLSEAERNSINLKNIVDAPEGEADPRLVAAKERVKAAKRRAKKVPISIIFISFLPHASVSKSLILRSKRGWPQRQLNGSQKRQLRTNTLTRQIELGLERA